MKETLKPLYQNVRVLLLVTALLLSLFFINPSFNTQGVEIQSVELNSSAYAAGITGPESGMAPTQKERILSLNNIKIESPSQYTQVVQTLTANISVPIQTSKGTRTITPKLNSKGDIDLGIRVGDVSQTNVRTGLDLQGGTRILLQPQEAIDDGELELLVGNIKERLNVYGLSDIVVRSTKDLSDNIFILIEIAGVDDSQIKALLAKQGVFEAKIGNETVFKGEQRDIAYVCTTPECSGINPICASSALQCRFQFAITLSPDAARRQAELTSSLDVVNGALSLPLDLYLDGAMIDSLSIASDLKGKAVSDISISGSGAGATHQEALDNTFENMKRLQTIMKTGSLPVKLDVVKSDTISPTLGHEFLTSSILVGFVAILAVLVVVFIRYRELIVALPMFITMVSEVIILLGLASLIKWNIDLAAIAGIIIAVGTGVDHQIVIASEIMNKKNVLLSWKQKIKRAFFIIVAAYLTTVVAMIPLLSAGAGIVKGFALTTILGVSIGVFITRPAYAAVVEYLFERRKAKE